MTVRTLALSLMMGLLMLGCQQNPVTGERQLVLIPTQQEIALGAEAAPEFEREFGGAVPDEALQQYLRDIGRRLAVHSRRQEIPYEFMLLNSDVPNAFALPGGKTYVTAGLMRRMTNERQLAAVMAHEIVHVEARHNIQGLQRSMGAAVLVELAGMAAGPERGEAVRAGTQVATGMLVLRYSRQQEFEADLYGMRYMADAEINPWGMVELLELLASLSQAEPGRLAELFQTHPLTSRRIEEAREVAEQRFPQWDPAEADANQQRFMQMRQRLMQVSPPPADAPGAPAGVRPSRLYGDRPNHLRR